MASSSSSSRGWLYDVFLSFRGEETRYNFTSHLHRALTQAGINTFMDSEELKRGDNITEALMHAIQGSKIALIVFSVNYAASSWCLQEVVEIMKCRKLLGQIVMPIFYHVDPSIVRRQSGSFSEAFQTHAARHFRYVELHEDKLSVWRAALVEAANLSGLHFANNGYESEFIKKIVDDISNCLIATYLNVAVYPVGIDARIEDICNSLSIGLDGFRMVGIWGMGGIGKTSLAKAIFNRFSHSFQSKSFLANVRETAKNTNGQITLQERLLSDILKPTKIKVGNVSRGINVIKERLGSKRVLLIVDDVDHWDQLKALALRRDSFGPGSRIIITTRDRHLLELLEVTEIHLTREMNEEEALELFSWHAFRNHYPDRDFLGLSRSVTTYCKGLPLALEVLGSFLFRRSKEDWKSTLQKLKSIPHDEIQEKLRISFDAIDEHQRDIFLHISCFFIGMDKDYVTKILQGCGLYADIDISVLLQRCLVTVSEKNKLMMHDLLRDMGREVVRAEYPKRLGKRSRLWRREDVIDVLTEESGTNQIEGLALNLQRFDRKCFRTKAFTKMKRLKFLQLNYVQLTGDYKYLSKSVKWLCWRGFSLKFIRKELLHENLVSIDLRYSNLVQIWEHSRFLGKLKVLNLSHSHYLVQLPDFSELPKLEYLVLKDCTSLLEIHESIGHLKRLALVNLKDCIMLHDLPGSFYELKLVKTLILSGCWRFENLGDIGKMISLKTLLVNGTSISKVPSSAGRLRNLDYLSQQGLIHLKLRFPEVPRFCFPDLPLVSTSFNMGSSSFQSLPKVSGLSNFESLCVNNCTALEIIPNASELSNMRYFHLSQSLKLKKFMGLDELLNYMTLFRTERRKDIIAPFRQSILQGWTASENDRICIAGNDITNSFAYVRNSDHVFVQVPKIVGRNLKGFTVCVDCSSCLGDMSRSGTSIHVTNYTQLTSFVFQPLHTEIASDEVIWQITLSNSEFNLEGGDFVEVEVVINSGFRVNKTGVSLIWEPILVDQNKIECELFPCDSFLSQRLSFDRSVETIDATEETGSSHDSSDANGDHMSCIMIRIENAIRRIVSCILCS